MNKEIITKVQNLINRAYVSNIDSKYYEGLFDEVEKLRQPPTLADFLGWEEGVEYKVINNFMKITNDGLEVYDDEEEWFDLWDGYWTNNNIIELRNAQKAEPKLKAYHVKDEYSYDCLMEELEEQGYMWVSGDKPTECYHANFSYFIFTENDKTITKDTFLRCLEDFNKEYGDEYELIEYHKEEPKFYARYKGSINLYQDYNYYNYLAWKGVCVISDKGEVFDSIIQMTKTEWNKLGINDTNADFEEVEE